MCILFLYINPKPSVGKFRLILAANRDEVYNRPSQAANFWEEDKNVIGGRDLEPGKEGGSWLAASRRGRIAALLNVMHIGQHAPDLLGRGSLVADFVKGKQTGAEYLKAISVDSQRYRPFNFLTIEVTSSIIDVYEFCNAGDAPKAVNVSCEYLGISNSFLDKPFAKVTAGVDQFKDIVENFRMTNNRKCLNNKLLDFLKQEKSHFPDAVMASFAPNTPSHALKPYSSLYVQNPDRNYGTRAHTIITVDDDNQAEFSEWTMKEPIDCNKPIWESSHFSLALCST